MKKVYTAFQFGNYSSGTDDVLNVTLENDMYNENIRGSRSIIEDKVQGVEAPYFFYVDDEPLEFEVNFAFEAKGKDEIKIMMRNLLAAKTYSQLKFGEYDGESFVQQSPIYNVIFVGEPVMSFIGRNVDGVLKYDGYFTLQARCDRPYGYENVSSFNITGGQTTHNSIADIELYPNIVISVTSAEATDVWIRSWTSAYTGPVLSQIKFTSIAANEVITINGNLFTITSDDAQGTIYSRWDKNNFKIFPGNNYITVTKSGSGTVAVSMNYDAPIFIKE
jgi:WD40 repeat protein